MSQTISPPVGDILNAEWEPCAIADVEALAWTAFGKAGTVKRLSSERDETFRLSTDGPSFTLKIANPIEDTASLAFQADVLLHLERKPLPAPVPRLVRTLDGQTSYALSVPGSQRVVRLLTYLDGEQLGATAASPQLCRNLGLALGALSFALADAEARPPAGKFLWDLTHFLDLESRLGFVGAERRAVVRQVLDGYASRVLPIFGDLRRQVIHNDFNPYNLLVDAKAPDDLAGIIDFGDMVFGPVVADLAVAASYHLQTEDWSAKLSAMLGGFCAVRRLEPAEIEALPTLIAARLATSVIISEWRATLKPDESQYILRNNRSAWLGLLRLSEAPPAELSRLIHDSCEASRP